MVAGFDFGNKAISATGRELPADAKPGAADQRAASPAQPDNTNAASSGNTDCHRMPVALSMRIILPDDGNPIRLTRIVVESFSRLL
ncbi:MAG: hypothetical protein KDJ16_10725 [Hyphomicrobiales bacterium]|nr:hypothetical protein [Hyphomicrobiales bacterium]